MLLLERDGHDGSLRIEIGGSGREGLGPPTSSPGTTPDKEATGTSGDRWGGGDVRGHPGSSHSKIFKLSPEELMVLCWERGLLRSGWGLERAFGKGQSPEARATGHSAGDATIVCDIMLAR